MARLMVKQNNQQESSEESQVAVQTVPESTPTPSNVPDSLPANVVSNDRSTDPETRVPFRWITIMAIGCVVFAGLDRAYEKHPHVEYESWFNFYGFAGLVATFFMILLAFVAVPLLSGKEDFRNE